MKEILTVFSYLRAFPAILAFVMSPSKDCIKQDIDNNLLTVYGGESYIYKFVYLMTWKKVFRNIFYYRIGRQNKLVSHMLGLFMPKLESCEISGEIGAGLAIWHGYNTIISCEKIGNNFSVWQGVTIGNNPKGELKVAKPIIGNNCSVYTNAIVAGKVVIGDNCRIGAGCVCMQSLKKDSLLVGSKSRVIEK